MREPSLGGSKKKVDKKSSAKQISSHEEKEEGYMQQRIPASVMWYLPVIDCLRCISENHEDPKIMTYHASIDRVKDDGKLQHLADDRQWKHLDSTYLEFRDEPRNVRLALSILGDLTSSHNTCLVILTIYNLALYLCQKHKYLLLAILIFKLK